MTVLRTTRPTVPRPRRAWAGVLALWVFGCGTPSPPAGETPAPNATTAPGTNDPNWLTSREKLPAPDLDRLDYDAGQRTLSLYPLPGQDRWMVQLPDELHGTPVGPLFRLPEGVDRRRTLVFYARPGVKVSAPVTVAAIEAGRRPHTSLAVNR